MTRHNSIPFFKEKHLRMSSKSITKNLSPYILPSGRLFAPSGSQIAPHVILVMYAGGIRNQETVDQMYLTQSQYTWNPIPALNVPGNIMPNMLAGAAPTSKVVYGTGISGNTPISPILTTPLHSQGVLFKEVNAVAAGHYGGSIALLQGNTNLAQPLLDRPKTPTIFEYLRKHGGYKATDTWFLGNSLGNSVPLYNHSDDPDYGAKYGANMFIPGVTFGSQGDQFLKNAKVYHPQNELSPMYKMKYFLDNVWYSQGKALPNIGNTIEEKAEIKQFVKDMFEKKENGTVAFPPSGANNDGQTIGYTCEVMKRFKPTLTVVYLSNVDSCHSNFTSYLQSLHSADHAVGHLWDYIQNQIPEMANNTSIIVSPEHGRNLEANRIKDANAFYGYDHSDSNARRIFNLMAGPGIDSNLVIGSETNGVGDIVNITPTIAEILGFKQDMINSGLVYNNNSLFDLI